MERPLSPEAGAVAALRRFTSRPAARGERCDLCGVALAEDHQHLIEPANRRLVCACDACAILFDNPTSKFVRVPRSVRRLTAPAFSDAQWDALAIPIGMAFFFVNSTLGRVVAMYPGAAGAAESLLPLQTWDELVPADSPVRTLRFDVEALLVNRVTRTPSAALRDYLVPIDLCYRLVGVIRSEWRGFSGGTEAWTAIERFYAELDARAEDVGEAARA